MIQARVKRSKTALYCHNLPGEVPVRSRADDGREPGRVLRGFWRTGVVHSQLHAVAARASI